MTKKPTLNDRMTKLENLLTQLLEQKTKETSEVKTKKSISKKNRPNKFNDNLTLCLDDLQTEKNINTKKYRDQANFVQAKCHSCGKTEKVSAVLYNRGGMMYRCNKCCSGK